MLLLKNGLIKVLKKPKYAQDVLNGVLANSEAIDARISEYAIDWTLERMPAVDRNILRVAVYEMFCSRKAGA
ncbi:MAG: transcription antitermination factor NusB [Phascolarctobacterium faecium]